MQVPGESMCLCVCILYVPMREVKVWCKTCVEEWRKATTILICCGKFVKFKLSTVAKRKHHKTVKQAGIMRNKTNGNMHAYTYRRMYGNVGVVWVGKGSIISSFCGNTEC